MNGPAATRTSVDITVQKMRRAWGAVQAFAGVLYNFIERSPVYVFGAVSIPVLLIALRGARNSAMWYDEIFTVNLCGLPVARIFDALRAGVDLQPPGFFLITRFTAAWFGGGTVGFRMVSVLAYWIFMACIFRFVWSRMGAPAALASALFLSIGAAFQYATEARPYALVLACTGVALVCWQEAGSNHRRWLFLAGLAAAIATAVSNHYFAALIVPPILAGEAARWIEKRRIDPWPAVAVVLGGAVILLYLPFVRGGMRLQSGKPWNPPALGSVYDAYALVLADVAVPAALALAAAVLTLHRDAPLTRFRLPLGEAVLCAAMIGIPAGGYILARFGSNMLTPRYMLPVAIPFAILFAWLFHMLCYRKPLPALLSLAILSTWFVYSGATSAAHPGGLHKMPEKITIPKSYDGMKIVYEDPISYLQAFYYGTRDFRARSTVIADPPLAAKYAKVDAVDRNVAAARAFFPFPSQDWASFSRENRKFLYCWSPVRFSWLQRQLADEHARIELLSVQGRYQLFSVTLP